MFHKITTTLIEQPKEHMTPLIDVLKDACKKHDDIDSLLLLDEYTQTTTIDYVLLKRVAICNDKNKIKKFIDRYKNTHLQIIAKVCYDNDYFHILKMILTDPNIDEKALVDMLITEKGIIIELSNSNCESGKTYLNNIFIENCKLNRIKLVKYLYDHGTDILMDNEEALKVSIDKNNKEIIRYLIDSYKCNIEKELLNDGLKQSAIDDDFDMVQYYLDNGADTSVLSSSKPQPWANRVKIQKFVYSENTKYVIACEENEQLKKENEKLKKDIDELKNKNEAIRKIVHEQ